MNERSKPEGPDIQLQGLAIPDKQKVNWKQNKKKNISQQALCFYQI